MPVLALTMLGLGGCLLVEEFGFSSIIFWSRWRHVLKLSRSLRTTSVTVSVSWGFLRCMVCLPGPKGIVPFFWGLPVLYISESVAGVVTTTSLNIFTSLKCGAFNISVRARWKKFSKLVGEHFFFSWQHKCLFIFSYSLGQVYIEKKKKLLCVLYKALKLLLILCQSMHATKTMQIFFILQWSLQCQYLMLLQNARCENIGTFTVAGFLRILEQARIFKCFLLLTYVC